MSLYTLYMTVNCAFLVTCFEARKYLCIVPINPWQNKMWRVYEVTTDNTDTTDRNDVPVVIGSVWIFTE